MRARRDSEICDNSTVPNFHALIAARGEHVPENLRAGNILQLRRDHADLAAATRLVPDVRLAYQRNAARSPADPARRC